MHSRTFGLLFALTFGGAFFEMAFLMNSMMAAPVVADAQTFHTVPLNDHGVVHYITPLQSTLFFYMLAPVVFILILITLWMVFSDKIEMLFKR